jgi:dGTP triphosphohydrolase
VALTKREIQKLRTQCNKLDDGPDYRINDYVTNLLNTVLDFKMNVGTVSSAMDHYEENHGYRTHKKLKEIIEEFPNTKRGNLRLANSLWDNNHWSRAKFLRKLINEFESRGIKGQQSLKKWIAEAVFESDVKGQFKTKEHSIGIALFQWLRLRIGVDTVKPDVHIVNFVSEAIGRNVSQEEALDSLLEVAKQTNRKAALLDAAIWHHQKKNA